MAGGRPRRCATWSGQDPSGVDAVLSSVMTAHVDLLDAIIPQIALMWINRGARNLKISARATAMSRSLSQP